jgi:pimeloyl-ACP methyl ester carboxylesterase
MNARDTRDRHLEGEPQIHYLEWPGAGETTALLIHGSFGNAQVWVRFASALGSRLTILAPDLRGHGSSAWANNGEYSLEAMVMDLERLLETRAPTGKLILVGHSLGNIMATKLASRYGERVRALILVDHACRIETDDHEHLIRAGRRPPRRFETEEEALAWAERLSGKNTENIAVKRMAQANITGDEHGAYRQAFDQRFLSSLTLWNAEPEMTQITCPVLIVSPGVDPVLRKEAAERMLRCFAQARLSVVADAGHNVFLDQPDDFTSLVLQFIDEVLED